MFLYYIFVLIAWAFPPAFVLVVGLLALALFLVRRSPAKRLFAISLALVISMSCVLICAAEAAFYGVLVSHEFIEPAPGNGESAFLKLGQGYDLQMSRDWTSSDLLHDQAWTGTGRFPERYDVTRLQIAGDWLLGQNRLHGREGSFFIVDSTNGTMTNFEDISQLALAARSSSVDLDLKSPESIYYENRSGRIQRPLWLLWIFSTGFIVVGFSIYLYRIGRGDQTSPKP